MEWRNRLLSLVRSRIFLAALAAAVGAGLLAAGAPAWTVTAASAVIQALGGDATTEVPAPIP